MKKLLALFLAFSMIFALAGCGNTAAEPEPDPEPKSQSEPEPEPEPEPAPALSVAEGMVTMLEPPEKMALTLEDGTVLALDVSGLSDFSVLGLWPGDTVKAEYTGAAGHAAAQKVEVTAKAELLTITGVVSAVSDVVTLTLEDGTTASFGIGILRELPDYEVRPGDTVTVGYVSCQGQFPVVSVSVKPAAENAEPAPSSQAAAPSQAAPAAPSQAASSQAALAASSQEEPSRTAKPPKGEFTVTAVVSKVDSGTVTFRPTQFQDWVGSRAVVSWRILEDMLGMYHPRVGEEVILGYVWDGEWPELSYMELPGSDDDYQWDNNDVYEVARLTNEERKKAGLPELVIDPVLMDVAQFRADEQPARYGHTRPDGSDWWTVFDELEIDLGGNYTCAENAASGQRTAKDVVDAWMNSKGHRENILRDTVTKIGVGYAYDGKPYWIQVFTS